MVNLCDFNGEIRFAYQSSCKFYLFVINVTPIKYFVICVVWEIVKKYFYRYFYLETTTFFFDKIFRKFSIIHVKYNTSIFVFSFSQII